MVLVHCDAVCLSPPGDRTMQVLAERVGFRLVLDAGRATAALDPICFFLIDYRITDDDKLQLLLRLRSNPVPDIRFAPVIVVVGSCPAEEVMKYVRWGFDDIIALPANAPSLIARLEAQLGSEHIYYETATYFGPDRRRNLRAATQDSARSPGRVIEHHFIRDPLGGTRLLRRGAMPGKTVPGLTETMRDLARI
jgi:DNA-binding response OmpR family regulator